MNQTQRANLSSEIVDGQGGASAPSSGPRLQRLREALPLPTEPADMTPLDPLDRNIVITEEERRRGVLSAEHKKLGAMLLHCRGYVVLHGAVPDELVTAARSTFDGLYADCTASATGARAVVSAAKATKTVFWERGKRIRIFPRLTDPFNSPYLLANPFAAPILEELLDARFYCKSVSSDTCVKGSVYQAPHRDLDFYDGADPFGCVVNIPLMHCGLHNGPIEVWPNGSHLWHKKLFFKFGLPPNQQDGDNPPVEDFMKHIPSKLVDLQPGDLMIRDPGMWHRGTPNTTEDPRTMLTISYFRRSYFYNYGDPYYNLDQEIFDALDPSVQRAFDYCFDKSSSLYWKLQGQRAFTKVEQQRILGAPVRYGVRMAERLREAMLRGH